MVGGISNIYQNNFYKPNTAPTSPTNLRYYSNRRNVTLFWDMSSDNETDSIGLSYNIMVGDSIGKFNICSPLAIPSTGKRLVAHMGNVELGTIAKINNLPDGKYYWSVQAIDNNFEGSPFAPIDSFIIDSSAVPLTLSFRMDSNLTCVGSKNAVATAIAIGGTAPYKYKWSTNEITNSISNLSSGTLFLTVTDSLGSTLTEQLIIEEPAELKTLINRFSCGPYFWAQSGKTYTLSGMYNDTTVSAAGCDSIITLNLNANLVLGPIITQTACSSYTWSQSGKTYSVSGIYNDTIVSAAGCDSIIMLDLIINQASSSTIFQTACGLYKWSQNGKTYTVSGIYIDTTRNAVGCDSIVLLVLSIDTLNLAVGQIESKLISYQFEGEFQWLNCDSGYTRIQGATTQTLMITSNGDYAVELTLNTCLDTSTCFTVSNVEIMTDSIDQNIAIYIFPNPTSRKIEIRSSENDDKELGFIYDSKGILMREFKLIGGNRILDLESLNSGLYLVRYKSHIIKFLLAK